jgi:hypothetical protein
MAFLKVHTKRRDPVFLPKIQDFILSHTVCGESMTAGPTLFEVKDASWHNSAAALTLSLMVLAITYSVTASKRTSCGNNTVLTLRTKTSNTLLKVVVTGSGLRMVELADRRVVTQLNTIHSHVRSGFDGSDMVQIRVGRRNVVKKTLPYNPETITISS